MSKSIFILLTPIFSLLMAQKSLAHVRSINPKNDEIIIIKTSLAFATIVQFPDVTPVQFPITGDQSAFRIEPIDNGVTRGLSIKPLRFGAKTNLFLFTDNRRFNFKIITVSEEAADYVLYIRTSEKKTPLVSQKYEKSVSDKNLKMTAHRISITKDSKILIDLTLTVQNEDVTLSPENIWIYQDKVSKVIDSLFLSKAKVGRNKPVQVALAISKIDLAINAPVQVMYKSKDNTLSLNIPAEVLWK